MKIENLIKDLEFIEFKGDLNDTISGISIDSRKIKNGFTYVAIKGFNVDGNNFINCAIENGANLIITENDIDCINNASAIKVENSRKALSLICKNFYNNPTKNLNIIGFTGTNGKTSSTYFMETILKTFNKNVGVIGTIEIRANGQKLDFDFATSTTPDTIELNCLFQKFLQKNIDNIAMEVSSHALELEKVSHCKFKIGVFTNLTQDHLDLHKNMENYCIAKTKLFDLCDKAVINADSEYAKKIIKNTSCKNIFTYSIDNDSNLKAFNIQYFMDKVEFDIIINQNVEHFILHIPGKFSIYNALGVISASLLLNIPLNIIKQGIYNIKGVKGRMQTIPNNKGFNVIVDYAHSPDGLKNVLKTVKEFTKGNVITIFGCGGDRDTKKRPIMGEISANISDYTIITSDNPRSEKPEKIIDEIEIGVKNITKNYEKIIDRKLAIFKGIKMAKKGDTIIIAGKGHEDYEIFADKIIHFDDAQVANEALKELN